MVLDDRGIIIACPHCGRSNRIAYDRLGRAVRCGQCKQELRAPAEPIEVPTVADFDRTIARASIPVVVDYWAPWCGPCRMVAPELVKLAARYAGRWLIVKVNTDVLTEIGERYNIRSIPTLGVFAGGREVTRTTGARPADEIERFVTQAFAAQPTSESAR
jgi:thioredoxin 2